MSSALNDDNDDDPNFSNHKINILGFRDLLPAKTASGQFADLIPYSNLGAAPQAFCRRENDGKELRVTIKNQGTANAGPTMTTVTFRDIKVTLNTPEIPSGSSTDLLFRIPINCFSPDCDFKITVDSENQIEEGNSESNNSVNGFCLG